MREEGRETDLPEVDPEENSQKFMGILIKVSTHTHTEARLHLATWQRKEAIKPPPINYLF